MSTAAAGASAPGDVFGAFGLRTFGRALALLFVVVAARDLAPDQLGRYAIVAAVVLLGSSLADLGTTTGTGRLVGRRPSHSDRILSGTLAAPMLLGPVAYVLAVALALAAGYGRETVVDVAVGGLAIPGQALASPLLAALRAGRRLAVVAGLEVLQVAVATLGGIAALGAGLGARGAAGALAAASFVTLAAAASITMRSGVWNGRVDWSPAVAVRLVRGALPFAVPGLIAALSLRLDVIVVSLLAGRADTAAYDLAVRVVETAAFLIMAVAGPSFVVLGRLLAGGDRERAAHGFRTAMRLLYLVGIPAAVLLACSSGAIARAAFGDGYGAVGAPLAILGGGLWLQLAVSAQATLLRTDVLARAALGLVALSTATMAVLDVVLVPRYGAAGAAWAAVLSTAVLSVALAGLERRDAGVATPWPPAGALAGAVAMAAGVLALRDRSGLTAAAGGTLAYVIVVIATGALRPADLRRIGAALSRAAPARRAIRRPTTEP